MKKLQDLGPTAVLLLTTMTFVSSDSKADPLSTWTPDLISRVRCVPVDVPEPGRYWLTLRTYRPSTAPSLMVLGDRGADPRPLERVESTMLEIDKPGGHWACVTSQVSLGEAKITFQEAAGFEKAGDPLEIEVEPDP